MLEVDWWQERLVDLFRLVKDAAGLEIFFHAVEEVVDCLRIFGVAEYGSFTSFASQQVGSVSLELFLLDVKAVEQRLRLLLSISLGGLETLGLTSGVPIYFLVPLMPPVSTRP
jgi:hypothetical protein